ncbi:titin isoform X1 [Diachasma alloeum]|uniref:titin isoform X1 n=1 Tax=Diachasma alloeum TaxID=454923 RepID=UPI000738258B|nr:titin isoform X1 [Diachasma alloeum]
MLHNVLRVIIEFIIIFNCVKSENVFKQNDKLPPGGLQMCIESFDVHKDKIIRTQDSLALGAKYIMEAEVDDRQNCLRLCCQTNDCDVFIFEEKKRGSCYLFHCGPPHDFKCKFTSHSNYTSAVLTNLSYRNPPYMEQAGRSQQEHELKSLRKLSIPQVPAEYIYTVAPVVITETPKPVVLTTPPPVKTRCSRNQYECRTSGDCIAIYNVCDGIPQCPDGSDEAAELGCPPEKPTPPPPVIPPMLPPPPELAKYPEGVQHRKNLQTFYEGPEGGPKPWQLPMGRQVVPQQGPPYPLHGGPGPQRNYGGQGYIGGWEYRQIYDQNKDNYPANNIREKGDVAHFDREQQPHIFNHKRPGMLPENAEGTGYVEPERPYESYYPAQSHAGWQQVPPQMIPIEPKPQIVPTPPPPVIKPEHPVPQEQVNSAPEPPPTLPPLPKLNTPTKLNPSIKKELETQKSVHPSLPKKVEPEVAVERQQAVKKDVEPVKEDISHSKQEERHTEETRVHHFVAEHLKQSNHRDSEEVLRPRGAVISLALGLTVTAIMAALIGCRLRVVRKRGRRGHGPYAHDADYLVNGMYL